ncbi:MAG: hypothetical protein M1536_05445 [Firmicutes bacterium]|nr:hypothetical protein [Bacillota bacterium]
MEQFREMLDKILKYLSGTTNYQGFDFDRAVFWAIWLVVAAFLTLLVAKVQLGSISRTAKTDSIKKFTDDFFRDRTRDILMLIDYYALKFRSGDIGYGEDNRTESFPYFLIDESIVRQMKISPEQQEKLINRKVYSAYEMDDFLLGHLEGIGSFEKQGLLDIEDVYTHFDWYVERVWEDAEIAKYIKYERNEEPEGDDIYKNFEYIFNKCRSFEQSKNKGELKFWWKFKWWLFKK